MEREDFGRGICEWHDCEGFCFPILPQDQWCDDYSHQLCTRSDKKEAIIHSAGGSYVIHGVRQCLTPACLLRNSESTLHLTCYMHSEGVSCMTAGLKSSRINFKLIMSMPQKLENTSLVQRTRQRERVRNRSILVGNMNWHLSQQQDVTERAWVKGLWHTIFIHRRGKSAEMSWYQKGSLGTRKSTHTTWDGCLFHLRFSISYNVQCTGD